MTPCTCPPDGGCTDPCDRFSGHPMNTQAQQRETFESWAEIVLGDSPTWRESADCELAWQAWQAAVAGFSPPAASEAADRAMVSVCREDANNYCRILTLLGMEEEGDPVAEIERLVAAGDREDMVQRLKHAIEGECDGLAVDDEHARAILEYVLASPPAPAPADEFLPNWATYRQGYADGQAEARGLEPRDEEAALGPPYASRVGRGKQRRFQGHRHSCLSSKSTSQDG